MDMLISIIFFIMFLIIIGVIIYLIYDFINYKENVDKSMELTVNEVNKNFTKVSNNINKTETKLTSDISQTNKDLSLFKQDTNMNQQILDNKIKDVSTNLDNFDSSLKKYFTFMDNNNQVISNKKIFKHVFESINPNLRLMANVEAVSGMTIKTSENLKDNKNLKICNTNNNCLQLNVNNDTFNLTPDNVNNLVINNTSNIPLARFDMKNNSIYFGGSDINSPMFIQNSNLYVNNINMIIKPPGTNLTSDNMKNMALFKITSEDMYTNSDMMSNMKRYYKTMNFIDTNKSLFKSALDDTTTNMKVLSDISTQIIVNYSLVNKLITIEEPQTNTQQTQTNTTDTQNTQQGNTIPRTTSYILNQLYFKIISNQNLKIGDIIEFEIPYYEIGNIITINIADNSKTYSIENLNINEQNVNSQSSVIEPKQTSALFKIQMNLNIDKNKPILFVISGNMLSYKELKDKYGVSVGKLVKTNNNILNSIQESYNKINSYYNS